MAGTDPDLKHVTIYTSGGCEPNPGRGGWAAVLLFGKARKEISGGCRLTISARMEITAAITALRSLKEPCRVTLFTDSQALVQAMQQGQALAWQHKNWMRTKTEKVRNTDLWEHLLALCDRHAVTFVWTQAHAGRPHHERCDQLAAEARQRGDLPVDGVYENETTNATSGSIPLPLSG